MAKSILKSENKPSRSVEALDLCWGDIEIYTFPNILGDNPAVSAGAPLAIDWHHMNKEVVGVEYHEYMRRKNNPRRKRKGLMMSSAERDTFLLGKGYNLQELLDAAEETSKIRKSREANMKGRFDTFKKVFNLSKPKTKPVARIFAAKSG
mmetsp:Transcript_6801/g.13468  ORF Transcript_6801/g.13468 Transcript_6801/m.13468 type:complete len:150 (-) Transcript_6801:133-582(-)